MVHEIPSSEGSHYKTHPNSHSLCCGVVELIFSRPCKAALYAAVTPEPPDHVGQVIGKNALLLGGRSQGEELLGIVLQATVKTRSW